MSDILPEDVDRMMVKCGRRCCICKRYRPTKLQVHHIHEKTQGGSDDEDNLIVTCFSCHSDVHTKVPFARRFSQEELKGHRDTLVKQVADGILPAEDTDDTDEVIRGVLQALMGVPASQSRLTDRAVEVLLQAVQGEERQQGWVVVVQTRGGTRVTVGGEEREDTKDNRSVASIKHALEQLILTGLLEQRSEVLYEVTNEGYLCADELLTSRAQAFTE